MKTSESITKLAPAFAKAQTEMVSARKSSINPFFNSTYANLEAVINCVREPFSNNGLCFMQFPIASDGFAGVETVIIHESGEFISNEFLLKCPKNDPQGFGSAITYAKRYGLQAAVGLPSEDDDGNAASKIEKEKKELSPMEETAQILANPKPKDWKFAQLKTKNGLLTLEELVFANEKEIIEKAILALTPFEKTYPLALERLNKARNLLILENAKQNDKT